MCQKCLDAVGEVMVGYSQDEIAYAVWNETAFPFCEPEMFRKQLIEYIERKENKNESVA
jgi:hypothetical protein